MKLRKYDDSMSLDEWKYKLDEFLDSIPDNPVTQANESGLCHLYTGKQTNTLLRWISFLGLSSRRGDTDIVPDFLFSL